MMKMEMEMPGRRKKGETKEEIPECDERGCACGRAAGDGVRWTRIICCGDGPAVPLWLDCRAAETTFEINMSKETGEI